MSDDVMPSLFPGDEPEPQEDIAAHCEPASQPEPSVVWSEPLQIHTAGRQAVKNGEALEERIRAHLLYAQYTQERTMPDSKIYPFFIHRWRKSGLLSVLRTVLIPDFFLWHPVKYTAGCLVECKWQEKPGSAEAKIELVIKSMLQTPYQVIVILNGPGFSRAYKEYYKTLEDTRLTVITSSDDLMVRMNRGLF